MVKRIIETLKVSYVYIYFLKLRVGVIARFKYGKPEDIGMSPFIVKNCAIIRNSELTHKLLL